MEVHPDRVTFKREIYNFLDLLGDIGGLREALKSFGALFIFICGQANGLNEKIISQLFKEQQDIKSRKRISQLDASKPGDLRFAKRLIEKRREFSTLGESFWLRCFDRCSWERRMRRQL